jgi:hypothetical protein
MSTRENGYAMAFHVWLARQHTEGFTYPTCDWRIPSVRSSWVYMNGPIEGIKVQYRVNTSVFGVVTHAGATITVKTHRRHVTMSYADFKLYWWVL